MSGAERRNEAASLRPRIRRREVAALAAQLGLMLDTGISLDAALRASAEQSDSPAVKEVALDLEQQIQDGVDLSAALARHPRSFEPVFVSLVRASEHTGSLGPCLAQQAEYLERDIAQRQRIRAALAYPCLMTVLAVAITIVLLGFVMPQFAPIFKQRQSQLPALTKALMALSASLTQHTAWWVAGSVVLAAAAVLWLRSDGGRRTLDALRLRLPVWGPAYRKAVLSRSVQTLGILLQNRVPILDALRLCAQVAGSQAYGKAWDRVAENVAAGARVGDSLPPQPMFPASLRQMLRAGEESGQLPMVLDKISAQYERETESAFKTATALLEPLMISAMGVVVGAIGWSLLIPIFSLSRPG